MGGFIWGGYLNDSRRTSHSRQNISLFAAAAAPSSSPPCWRRSSSPCRISSGVRTALHPSHFSVAATAEEEEEDAAAPSVVVSGRVPRFGRFRRKSSMSLSSLVRASSRFFLYDAPRRRAAASSKASPSSLSPRASPPAPAPSPPSSLSPLDDRDLRNASLCSRYPPSSWNTRRCSSSGSTGGVDDDEGRPINPFAAPPPASSSSSSPEEG
mmetsp:Transcript_3498/g.9122  ORF Transcript_3498/g.9122 Transcript_3498/m.9122 type:complete len:211 (-) Transcript_3498:245-877(-)